MPRAMREDEQSYRVKSSSFGIGNIGRFVSKLPMTAGKNAGKSLFARAKSISSLARLNVVTLELEDTTKGDKKRGKLYYYRVTRTKIPSETHDFKSQFVAKYKYKAVSIEKAEYAAHSDRTDSE